MVSSPKEKSTSLSDIYLPMYQHQPASFCICIVSQLSISEHGLSDSLYLSEAESKSLLC